MYAVRKFPGPDLFEKAKQLSLNDFIRNVLGASGKMNRLYVRYPTCPDPACRAVVNAHSVRLVIRDDTTFRCFRCGAFGTIIDAAMLIWGFDKPLDAARALTGELQMPPKRESVLTPEFLAEQEVKRAALNKALLGIRVAADEAFDDKVNLRYLTEERCIPLSVVRDAQERRLLGFLPSSRSRAKQLLVHYVGEDLLRAAGFWDTKYPDPWIARRPLIFFFPGMTAAEFRLNREPRGDEKKSLRKGSTDYPWFWRGEDDTRALAVEGFIDVLSAVAMGYPGHTVGMPGCNNWDPEWFVKLRETGVRSIDIGFDDDWDTADNPGQEWAGILAEHLRDIRMEHRIARPQGGDMNALLKARGQRSPMHDSSPTKTHRRVASR